MTDDLVKRLRDWEHVWPDDMDKPAGHLYEDAADRIEELEARMIKGNNTGYRNTGNWNTGNRNTGSWNTGYRNTGYRNTGDWNTGARNTGSWNTGDWNTGDHHVGCFNTINAEKAYYFNKMIDKELWDKAEKPDWLYKPTPTTWVVSDDMDAHEKAANKSYKTTGGYLRVNDMKAEWRKAYDSATEEEIQMVRDLPAFDYDVFEEITGLDLRVKKTAPCEGREIEIDGVTYVLKVKGGKDE